MGVNIIHLGEGGILGRKDAQWCKCSHCCLIVMHAFAESMRRPSRFVQVSAPEKKHEGAMLPRLEFANLAKTIKCRFLFMVDGFNKVCNIGESSFCFGFRLGRGNVKERSWMTSWPQKWPTMVPESARGVQSGHTGAPKHTIVRCPRL